MQTNMFKSTNQKTRDECPRDQIKLASRFGFTFFVPLLVADPYFKFRILNRTAEVAHESRMHQHETC